MKPQMLQSTGKTQMLEHLLRQYDYLSKDTQPGPADAQLIECLRDIGKVPNRLESPRLYSWYVLLVQFSPKTYKSWLKTPSLLEQDPLVSEFMEELQALQSPHHNGFQKSNSHLMDTDYTDSDKELQEVLKDISFSSDLAFSPIQSKPFAIKVLFDRTLCTERVAERLSHFRICSLAMSYTTRTDILITGICDIDDISQIIDTIRSWQETVSVQAELQSAQ